MAFTKKIYRLKKGIEVEEYHSAKYGAPGQERRPKKKLTPEQMEKQNQTNREKKARRKLREHFQEEDYFSDLTYRKDARPPDMEAAKEQFSKCIRQVRKEYRKRGYGKVINTLMYEKGGFADLAAYITKTPATDPRLRESDYSASRNLPIPEPEKKIYRHWKTWKEIKVPAGYYLDKSSVKEGINPYTGYRYRSYSLLPLQDGGKKGGKRSGGQAAGKSVHRDIHKRA